MRENRRLSLICFRGRALRPGLLPLPSDLLLSLPLVDPLVVPLLLFDRGWLETRSPCCVAKSLTQSPMPCCPAASLALQSATVVVTCWPQSAGLRLPVIATSVVATAPAAAKAATAKPVASLRPSAAPAPPSSLFENPPEVALRSGIGAAAIGSRTRCSSRSSSRSKSPGPFMASRNQLPGRITHFSWERCGFPEEAAAAGRGLRPGEKPRFARERPTRSRSRGCCTRGSGAARWRPPASAAACARLPEGPIARLRAPDRQIPPDGQFGEARLPPPGAAPGAGR